MEHPTMNLSTGELRAHDEALRQQPSTTLTSKHRNITTISKSEGGEADREEDIHESDGNEEEEVANEENESACAGAQWR